MKREVIALFVAITLMSCINNSTPKGSSEDSCCSSTTSTKVAEVDVVEVLYMHGKQRCVTCVAIGTQTADLIKELDNDKVVMRTIDFSTPEGEKIADRYEIASSSLLVVRGGKVENMTAIGFQYAKSNPELFKRSLKESIEKMLE